MATLVTIDLNVRIGGNQTFAGFEDVDGPIRPGGEVTVVEPESGIQGPGRVVRIDAERELIYLEVEWSRLSRPSSAADAAEQAIRLGLDHDAVSVTLVANAVRATTTTSGRWGGSPHLEGGAYINLFDFGEDGVMLIEDGAGPAPAAVKVAIS